MAEKTDDIDFLRERERHGEALLALSRRIEGAHSEKDAFDAAFDILRAHTGYRHYWIFVFDEDGRHAHFHMGSTGPESDPATATLTIPGDPMLEEIAASRDIVVVEDARTDPRTNKEIVARIGNRTIINVPILFNARNLGAVGTGTFGDEGIRLPSPAERDFLKAVASHLAISLDRIRNRTEWQRAERQLQAGEARYRSLVGAMAEGVVFHDERGVVTAINPAAERILGVEAAAMLGRASMIQGAALLDDGKPLAESELPWNLTMNTGAAQADINVGIAREGADLLWLSINTAALDPGGTPPHAVVTTFRDITEQRGMQQQLEMVRTALDCSSDSVFLMDGERIFQVNQGACTSLGYSLEELVGKGVFDFDPVMTPERLQQLMESSLRSNRIVFESCHQAKDGRIFPVEVDVTPFLFDGRHLAMALTRDITERKRHEDALLRLNRTLLTLSSGNEALVRAGSETDLLERMCNILVSIGGHRVVWIDLTDRPNGRKLRPAASATADNAAHFGDRRVPCGDALALAMESGEPVLIGDIHSDALSAECREALASAGGRSGAVLPLIANQGLIGTLSIFAETPEAFDKTELDLLKELADDLAFGIQAQRTHAEQQQSVARLQKTMEATIQALANTLELRDPYTAGHQRRVAALARAIALRIGLDAERAEVIYLAGMIHDIGKIHVPSEVLTRPGKLTPLEYSLVQTHVEAGYGLLQPIDFPWPLAEIIYQHHERLDGSGYPRGIRGDEVMLEARILAVADVVEATSAHRPYRPGLGLETAMAEIESGKDRFFDPAVVDGCVALFREDGFQFE
jgi:PAS domain S-box-containing protein